ncbi:LCP family protein [Marinicrinis lubricantis]|uniref:LCP family protein n=1 Tax=Marinicrinis lubricantis TaxID=2086470 RepID=A0ABW1IJ69_9BACL
MRRIKWKWVALIVLLLIVGTASYYAYGIYKFGQEISKDPEESRFKDYYKEDEPRPYEPPAWEGDERLNILLLGGDSRGVNEGTAPRSDTMLVASVDPVTKKAHLFSILRDSWVDIPDHGMDRINSALSIGGPDLAMKTVSDYLGIPIQYYVFVDFVGFQALVDAIGGIDYYVEKDMYYSSRADGPEYTIDLKEGFQHLDGKEALQYVRFRYDAMSDYSRTERQRAFLKAVVAKVQSTSNLIKLPSILEDIAPYIETNISMNKMLRMGTLAFQVDTSEVGSVQIPPFELLQETNVGGASVLGSDPEQVQQYVQETFTKEPEAETTEGTDGTTGTDGTDSPETTNESGSAQP